MTEKKNRIATSKIKVSRYSRKIIKRFLVFSSGPVMIFECSVRVPEKIICTKINSKFASLALSRPRKTCPTALWNKRRRIGSASDPVNDSDGAFSPTFETEKRDFHRPSPRKTLSHKSCVHRKKYLLKTVRFYALFRSDGHDYHSKYFIHFIVYTL